MDKHNKNIKSFRRKKMFRPIFYFSHIMKIYQIVISFNANVMDNVHL